MWAAMHHVNDMSKLNTSSKDVYRFMNGSEKEVPATKVHAWIDVRDVRKAHRLAYENFQAGGPRYLAAAGLYSYQQIVDIIKKGCFAAANEDSERYSRCWTYTKYIRREYF